MNTHNVLCKDIPVVTVIITPDATAYKVAAYLQISYRSNIPRLCMAHRHRIYCMLRVPKIAIVDASILFFSLGPVLWCPNYED